MSIFLSYLLFIVLFTALALGLYFSLQAVKLI
uniref:Cytochrome b6-f complex subunit 6 n=2 Tax=Gelidium TaxID=2811 RepID=A0A411FSP4_9FLOR|nr:cytochrome b6-f complex subunit VI [Gelidium coulteri]YP_009565234.1 cytochrome b6-f complex subunit VI [Gelidium sinicola]QBA96185.1 cytochrome b6-f complex subunit VI [Gelidium coulteri]QBA96585.1 cytochrome b6-f complex subunit VI [Gelidium sinicola]